MEWREKLEKEEMEGVDSEPGVGTGEALPEREGCLNVLTSRKLSQGKLREGTTEGVNVKLGVNRDPRSRYV